MTQQVDHTVANASRRKRFGNAPPIVLLLSALLFGCGGGNSQPAVAPAPPPVTFDLIFPGETSLTDGSQIAVVGIADANRLTSVTIKSGSNETVAILDNDGRWRAEDVPLQPGNNSLVAELTETNGTVTELAIGEVRSSPILSSPTAVQYDAANDHVLVVDAKQLLAFDLATATLRVISSPRAGTGSNFNFAQHLALTDDGAVLVSSIGSIQKVDPTTGDRSDHVVLPSGAGPISTVARDQQLNRLFMVGFFGDLHVADLTATPPILATTVKPLPTFGITAGGPTDSVYVAATDTIYTVRRTTLDMSAIDATTGEAEPILLNFGGFVAPPAGIDYDEVSDRVLVLGLSGAVFSLDPTTRSNDVLLPPPATTTSGRSLSGLSLGNGELWTVSQVSGELVSIDLVSGNQTTEADSRVGGGASLGPMLAGRYDVAADRFIAVAGLRLIAIDPKTGSRQPLVELFDPAMVLTGSPDFLFVSAMSLSRDGTRAWLADQFSGTVSEANLSNGEVREVSSTKVGSGELPDQITGIAVNAAETLAYVADRFTRRIFSIDLATGQRELLPEFAAGLDLSEIRSLVLDPGANRLLLNIVPFTPASAVAPAIYALDLASFELTLVADLSSVQLPFSATLTPGISVIQMSLSADGKSLYYPVSGNPDIPYARIDMTFGEITLLGTASNGVPFFVPNAIEAAPDGRLFALDGTGALLVIDAQTGERAVVSK